MKRWLGRRTALLAEVDGTMAGGMGFGEEGA